MIEDAGLTGARAAAMTNGMSAFWNTRVPCFTLLLCAGLLAAYAQEAPDPSAPLDDASGSGSVTESGASPGGRPILECEVDSDCLPQRLEPFDATIELMSATCKHINYQSLPSCECNIGGTYREPTTGEYQTTAGPFNAGNRDGGCSEFGRTPGSCVYCGSEFPGCDIADATSCDAVCADMIERLRVEWERTLPVTTRLARCNERPNEFTCDTVFEVDGVCYSGPLQAGLPPLDCSLSDEELATHRFDSSQYPGCTPRAAVACSRAEDCPRGLACNEGTCQPCGLCAAGEVCVDSTCVLEANAACSDSMDCPEEHSCLISGISATGRGNESTYTFCQPPANPPSAPRPPREPPAPL